MSARAAASLLAALALGGCAGEQARPRRAVEIATPTLDGGEVDAAVADAFVPVDARPPAPDADAAPPAPENDLRVFVRVRADAWADGLRAALSPPQRALDDVAATLAALGPGATPAFDFDRPDDAAEARLRDHLARGTATVVFAPERHPESLETDLRHVAAWVLDDARCARWADVPLLFVEPPASPTLLADTLERIAALPHGANVLLGFDPLAPTPLPPGLSAAAQERIVGRWSMRGSGWSADGTGDLPDAAETRTLSEAWRAAALAGAVVPLARAARNPRLGLPGAPFEAPGADAGLLRSLVLARRLASAGDAVVLVDGVGAWGADLQLDALAPGVDGTREPAALTGGAAYEGYGARRVEAARTALLEPPGPPPDLGAGPVSLAELQRSDTVSIERLELVGGRVELALRDRGAGGRLAVLLEHRRFRVPPGARVVYTRTEPSVRVEWVMLGDAPEATPTTLRALSPDAPRAGRVEIDVAALAGRVVDSVVLLYDGGTGALQASVTLPAVTVAP